MELNWIVLDKPTALSEAEDEDGFAIDDAPTCESLGIVRCGIVLDVQDKGLFLIDDVNTAKGSCGCCSAIHGTDLVLRYAEVYQPTSRK